MNFKSFFKSKSSKKMSKFYYCLLVFCIILNIISSVRNFSKYYENGEISPMILGIVGILSAMLCIYLFIYNIKRGYISKKKREEFLQNRFKNLYIIYNYLFQSYESFDKYALFISTLKMLPEEELDYAVWLRTKILKIYMNSII